MTNELRALVVYATKHGATGEIAEEIGQVLRHSGVPTDVLPVDNVADLDPYAAVIFGSAVYIGQWRKEAIAFLEANEHQLADRAVWIFSSGPTGEGDPVELMQGWRLPEAQQALVDRIKPCEVVVFHGALDPKKLNFAEKMIVRGVKAPVGDFRSWNTIAAWAADIAQALKNDQRGKAEARAPAAQAL